MDIHKNARFAPAGREGMVRCVIEQGRSLRSVAGQFGVTVTADVHPTPLFITFDPASEACARPAACSQQSPNPTAC